MQIIVEEIDGTFYIDVILRDSDIHRLRLDEMVEDTIQNNNQTFSIGVRLSDVIDTQQEDWFEETDLEDL